MSGASACLLDFLFSASGRPTDTPSLGPSTSSTPSVSSATRKSADPTTLTDPFGVATLRCCYHQRMVIMSSLTCPVAWRPSIAAAAKARSLLSPIAWRPFVAVTTDTLQQYHCRRLLWRGNPPSLQGQGVQNPMTPSNNLYQTNNNSNSDSNDIGLPRRSGNSSDGSVAALWRQGRRRVATPQETAATVLSPHVCVSSGRGLPRNR